MGAACSILLFMLMLVYTGYKVDILLEKGSVDILESVQLNYFDNNYVFDAGQGFKVAAAVVDPFNLRSEPEIDPTYGRIRFSTYEWWLDESQRF